MVERTLDCTVVFPDFIVLCDIYSSLSGWRGLEACAWSPGPGPSLIMMACSHWPSRLLHVETCPTWGDTVSWNLPVWDLYPVRMKSTVGILSQHPSQSTDWLSVFWTQWHTYMEVCVADSDRKLNKQSLPPSHFILALFFLPHFFSPPSFVHSFLISFCPHFLIPLTVWKERTLIHVNQESTPVPLAYVFCRMFVYQEKI